MTNNFSLTMPDDKQYMRAIQTFKDEYLLDFINTEELDLTDPQDLDERVLETEIISNIRNFIQCLGSGCDRTEKRQIQACLFGTAQLLFVRIGRAGTQERRKSLHRHFALQGSKQECC
ncbi:MAG TPA: hypothetical protein IAC37_03720 [Candidatus Ventrimonas merdavium]|nr:hypothetical protein [Candidatus Ventrimonas merdavium]